MSRKTHVRIANTIDLRPRRRRIHPARFTTEHHGEDLVAFRLAVVTPVAKTALTPGTVVWAHIPFEETDGWKLRPAVVSHTCGRDVVVYPGTTADSRHRYPGAYRELADLDPTGLRRATGVELTPVTIDVIDVVSVAGELGSDDRCAVVVVGTGGDIRSELAVAA